MADKEKKFEGVTLITPIAPSGYNHLNKPDEFKGQKNFKTSQILTPEQLDEIKGKIEEVIDTQYDEVISKIKNPKNKKKVYKVYPWVEEEDDDGEETGNFILRYKSAPKKNGKRRFPIVDSQGNPTNVIVFGGSTIRVEVYVKGYSMDVEGPEGKFKKVGATLYINAVQVIELAGDGGGSGGHKFGKVDGGFVSQNDDDEDDDDANDEGDDDDDGEDDF